MVSATAGSTSPRDRQEEAAVIVSRRAGLRVERRWLLREVTFELPAAQLVAIVGPNGAGKSTMLSLISGDSRATEGEVRIGGRPPRQWSAKQLGRFRSVMVQQQRMSFAFSVQESVEMGRLPHPAEPRRDASIVGEALDRADLHDLRSRDVTTLSGGEGARTAFARVLAQAAPVMLLDEPTAALDLYHQEVVLGTAAALRDWGCCVVAVLHDLNLAARYADRVLMFAQGRLVADGTPHQVLTAELIEHVYHQPVHALTQPGSGLPLILPASGADRPALGDSIREELGRLGRVRGPQPATTGPSGPR